MARIPMRNGFTIIPEGVYIFRIEEVKYDEDFGKIEIRMVTSDGKSLIQRYNIRTASGELNETALSSFSYFAKNAMNDFEMEDVDPADMVGHYIEAEVVHNTVQSKDGSGKERTFANLGEKSPAFGFEGAEAPSEPATGLDIEALLNM